MTSNRPLLITGLNVAYVAAAIATQIETHLNATHCEPAALSRDLARLVSILEEARAAMGDGCLDADTIARLESATRKAEAKIAFLEPQGDS